MLGAHKELLDRKLFFKELHLMRAMRLFFNKSQRRFIHIIYTNGVLDAQHAETLVIMDEIESDWRTEGRIK